MTDVTPPTLSPRALLISTAAAAAFAALVLVTVVLPAEWGVDPTGIGRAIGLTRLAEAAGEIPEVELGDDAGAALTAGGSKASAPEPGIFREDTVQIEVPAGGDLEYKFGLAKGSTLDYAWQTDRGLIFSELHGEPKGDRTGYYEDFVTSRAQSVKGSLEAPFEGSHGWYWKNENEFPVKITLTTRGIYAVIGKI
jgi:hypothetical protein